MCAVLKWLHLQVWTCYLDITEGTMKVKVLDID